MVLGAGCACAIDLALHDATCRPVCIVKGLLFVGSGETRYESLHSSRRRLRQKCTTSLVSTYGVV